MNGVTQYIGARYVPIFYTNSDNTSEWRSGVIYEPLTIVTWNNNSYTSKKPVPANIGNPSDNPEYWAATGMYNQQVASLTSRIEEIEDLTVGLGADPINALTLGIKNDGSEDISVIVNSATAEHSIYFPAGVYRVDHPLELRNSIFGCQRDILEPQGTVFLSYIGEPTRQSVPENQRAVIEGSPLLDKSIEVSNITVRMDDTNSGYEMGLKFVNAVRGNCIYIEGMNIFNPHGYAGYFHGYQGNSRMITMTGCTVWGYLTHYATSAGWWFGPNTMDSRINDCLIAGVRVGLYLQGALYYISNIHIFNGAIGGVPSSTDWAGSVGISLFTVGASFVGTNIYLDSPHVGVLANAGNNTAQITNLMYIVDGNATPDLTDGSIFIGSDTSTMTVTDGIAICAEKVFSLNNLKNFKIKNVIYKEENPGLFTDSTYRYRKWMGIGDSYGYDGGSGQGWCKKIATVKLLFASATFLLSASKGSTTVISIGRTDGDLFAYKKTLTGTATVYYKALGGGYYEIWADIGTGNRFDLTLINGSSANVLDMEANRTMQNERIPLVTMASATDLTEITEA